MASADGCYVNQLCQHSRGLPLSCNPPAHGKNISLQNTAVLLAQRPAVGRMLERPVFSFGARWLRG